MHEPLSWPYSRTTVPSGATAMCGEKALSEILADGPKAPPGGAVAIHTDEPAQGFACSQAAVTVPSAATAVAGASLLAVVSSCGAPKPAVPAALIRAKMWSTAPTRCA